MRSGIASAVALAAALLTRVAVGSNASAVDDRGGAPATCALSGPAANGSSTAVCTPRAGGFCYKLVERIEEGERWILLVRRGCAHPWSMADEHYMPWRAFDHAAESWHGVVALGYDSVGTRAVSSEPAGRADDGHTDTGDTCDRIECSVPNACADVTTAAGTINGKRYRHERRLAPCCYNQHVHATAMQLWLFFSTSCRLCCCNDRPACNTAVTTGRSALGNIPPIVIHLLQLVFAKQTFLHCG